MSQTNCGLCKNCQNREYLELTIRRKEKNRNIAIKKNNQHLVGSINKMIKNDKKRFAKIGPCSNPKQI